MNIEAEIVGIKKDIEYLKTEHQEFKEFMKKFESVPYKINSIDEKLETLLDRVQAVEEEVPEEDKKSGLIDMIANNARLIVTVILILLSILGTFAGVDTSALNSVGGS